MSGRDDGPLFDAVAFALEVRLAMAKGNLSLRQLQDICGVDQASIHRVAKKQLPPSIETYLRLRRWLDGTMKPSSLPQNEECGR